MGVPLLFYFICIGVEHYSIMAVCVLFLLCVLLVPLVPVRGTEVPGVSKYLG